MKLWHKVTLTMGAMVASTGAMAQAVVDPVVSAAATEFGDTFGLNMAAVGGAIITAAFLAIGYKWVKGAIFS
jgi:CO/xanthine dehydrogenase FAD-binding subunit